MRARIIRIGNSHGIRIPKALLAACRLKDEVDQIRTVDRERLLKRLGAVDSKTLDTVLDVLLKMFSP